MSKRPPFPPFSEEDAIQKVRMAENAWNLQDPEKIALAYTEDSRWRNRAEFFNGRKEIIAFLKRKWARELDYRLIELQYAFNMNITMIPITGSEHMEMKIGNLMSMD